MTNAERPYWVIWKRKIQGAVFLHLLLGNSQWQWQVDFQNPHAMYQSVRLYFITTETPHKFFYEYIQTVSNMPFVSVNVSLRVTPDLKVKMPLCWFTTMTEGQKTWDNFSTRFHGLQVPRVSLHSQRWKCGCRKVRYSKHWHKLRSFASLITEIDSNLEKKSTRYMKHSQGLKLFKF